MKCLGTKKTKADYYHQMGEDEAASTETQNHRKTTFQEESHTEKINVQSEDIPCLLIFLTFEEIY